MIQSGINLSELGSEIADLTAEIKRLTEEKEAKRKAFFAVANDSFAGKEYLLPTITISVPYEIISEIGEDTFLNTRYPSYDVLSHKYDSEAQIFEYVLRRKASVMPFNYEDDNISVARSPSESTPTIDWENLRTFFPDEFESIAKEVVSYELDEEAFTAFHAKHPQVAMSILQNFAVHKAPALRVLAKRNDK